MYVYIPLCTGDEDSVRLEDIVALRLRALSIS